MKDFRKITNWKKFSKEWPESLTDAILICSTDEFGLPEDEYTVAYLDNVDGEVGVNVFGYTYCKNEEDKFLADDLKNYVWDYLE